LRIGGPAEAFGRIADEVGPRMMLSTLSWNLPPSVPEGRFCTSRAGAAL
jgi:hypothetical protein